MASGISHMLLARELVNHLADDDSGPKMDLLSGLDFLEVGAIAPDLPYASIADDDFFLTTQSDLADSLHYDRTNEVPLSILQKLRQEWPSMRKKRQGYAFSFVAGYLSHIVADGLIHPFVRDMVGDYKQNQTAHRVLEMQLDVLLFHYLTEKTGQPIELNRSNLHDELKNISTFYYSERGYVLGLFSNAIKDIYGASYSVSTIRGWVKGLHRMFSVAEGEHGIYRNIGFINNFLFSNYADLVGKYDAILSLRQPKDRTDNFLKEPKVHFFDDIVPKFFASCIPLVTSAYGAVTGTGPSLTDADVPPIDLDTGRLLADNRLDNIPTLWA